MGRAVESVRQLRVAMESVDPALLTHDDRAALLELVARSYDAKTAGGGVLAPSPRPA